MIRTVIIGSGNVAHTLARALTEVGAPPVQIFARNAAAAKEIALLCGCGYGSDPPQLAVADLYIISVSDRAISGSASSLEFGNAVVAHTSGSVGIDVFPGKIKNAGVIYPLQTFSKGRRIDLRKTPFLIEGATPLALKIVRETAGILSDNVMEVDSARRALIHVAAVFASNFTNYMYAVGEELAAEAGMDFSTLKPLIEETALKALASESPRYTQTGPASRNDFQTKSLHSEMLRERPDLKTIYTNLSNNIWEISKKISQR